MYVFIYLCIDLFIYWFIYLLIYLLHILIYAPYVYIYTYFKCVYISYIYIYVYVFVCMCLCWGLFSRILGFPSYQLTSEALEKHIIYHESPSTSRLPFLHYFSSSLTHGKRSFSSRSHQTGGSIKITDRCYVSFMECILLYWIQLWRVTNAEPESFPQPSNLSGHPCRIWLGSSMQVCCRNFQSLSWTKIELMGLLLH